MRETISGNEYVQRLLRYIDDNISANIDIELLSSVGSVSRDKLYADFYSLSGHTVKKYIRNRRLSNALALIKISDLNISEIAVQYGYSSHQALCRAVRQTLCTTPSEYKTGDMYYFFPPFNGKPLQSVTVSNETIPDMLRVLFYHSKLTGIENTALDAFLTAIPDYNGRIFGKNGQQRDCKFCYKLYLTDINRDYIVLKQHGFCIANIIPCTTGAFAYSTVQNDESKINAVWDYLYAEWLQNSMFEYTGEPYYEEYILKNNKPVKLKLYLPIRERCETNKISLINNPQLRFVAAKAKGYNAEEIASQIVINYLSTYHPYIVNTSKEMYLQKNVYSYVCGVKVNLDWLLVQNENIINVTTDGNAYLVLESSVMGDYDRYVELLFLFAKDNNISVDKQGVFAVYDASESFDNLKIKMYCPVKIRTE